MTIIPGYCVVGTVGNKLLTGRSQTVEIDKKTTLEVKCKIANLSFSAHADAKGKNITIYLHVYLCIFIYI